MPRKKVSLKDGEKFLRKTTEEFLAKNPAAHAQIEAEYERYSALFTSRGAAVPRKKEAYVAEKLAARAMMAHLSPQIPKIDPKKVAAHFGGELPKGWDDLLPPEKIKKA